MPDPASGDGFSDDFSDDGVDSDLPKATETSWRRRSRRANGRPARSLPDDAPPAREAPDPLTRPEPPVHRAQISPQTRPRSSAPETSAPEWKLRPPETSPPASPPPSSARIPPLSLHRPTPSATPPPPDAPASPAESATPQPDKATLDMEASAAALREEMRSWRAQVASWRDEPSGANGPRPKPHEPTPVDPEPPRPSPKAELLPAADPEPPSPTAEVVPPPADREPPSPTAAELPDPVAVEEAREIVPTAGLIDEPDEPDNEAAADDAQPTSTEAAPAIAEEPATSQAPEAQEAPVAQEAPAVQAPADEADEPVGVIEGTAVHNEPPAADKPPATNELPVAERPASVAEAPAERHVADPPDSHAGGDSLLGPRPVPPWMQGAAPPTSTPRPAPELAPPMPQQPAPPPPPGWIVPPPGWIPPPPPPPRHRAERPRSRRRHEKPDLLGPEQQPMYVPAPQGDGPRQDARPAGWVPPPHIGAPPPNYLQPQAFQTPTSLDEAEIVRRGRNAPKAGWRKAVYVATGGHVIPSDSKHEREKEDLLAQIRQPIHGDFRIAVLSIKGGVGKTTTTLGLGSALALVRTDRIIAVDANPDRGTLAERVRDTSTASTVRDLLSDPNIHRYADVRSHTRMSSSRLEVLASEQDPEVSEVFGDEDYRRTVDILRHYYNIILTDCGTGIMHSAMSGVLDLAHTIVLVSSPAMDAARSASATLDWLNQHGHARLVREAHVVLSASRPGSASLRMDKVYEHFEARCRSIHLIPFDPHLAEGADIDFTLLKRDTFAAYLELAGAVAEHFPMLSAARRRSV